MDVVDKITRTIEPSLENMGYRLVQVKFADGGHRRKTLTLMAERNDGKSMSVDDCADISRTAGALLEVEDPINSAYDLEVCSPGIDRPLTRISDFSNHLGYEAKLETQLPIEGRRRFRGLIKSVENETIRLAMPEGEVNIPFQNVRNAKLVLTDALIASHLKKQKKQEA